MKIISIKDEELTVIPDTAMLRNGDPFFAPDFATLGIEEVGGIAVKITRLVKCIEPKFAHRTWEEWVNCTHHRAMGIQAGIGLTYDRSFEVGVEIHQKNELTDEQQQQFNDAIAYASKYVSLRIGDYVFKAR